MSKRQLSSKYKDLADWVKQVKYSDYTTHSLAFIISYIYDCRKERKISDILNDLNEDLTLNSSNDLISIIVDIYNDNYEPEEPEYYWKFKEPERVNKYAVYFGLIDGDFPVLFDVTQKGRAKKCTKSELNDYWHYTNLTADNFVPVKEVEND